MQEACTGSMSGDESPKRAPARPGDNKTPLQVLHEYCMRKGISPVFIFNRTGASHSPTFVVRVSIGEITCTGRGPTKKLAKNRAANNLVRIMGMDTECIIVDYDEDSKQDNKYAVNALRLFADANNLSYPTYRLVGSEGQDHCRVFTVLCEFGELHVTGTGSSKKIARRIAAYNMLSEIDLGADFQKKREDTGRHSSHDSDADADAADASNKTESYVDQLCSIAAAFNFGVAYASIDSIDMVQQCLVELDTNPVVVCRGSGCTCELAREDAAYTAIQYLKIALPVAAPSG